MESLCVKAGINNGLIGPYNGPKPNNKPGPNQHQYPTVVIPTTTAAAADSSSSKFSSFNINNFKYPLKSLFSGRNYNKGVSLNDAVLVDDVETKQEEEEGGNGNNWLFKILHFRKKCDQGQNGNFGEVSDAMSSTLCDCEGFEVVKDGESVGEFDRESFSRLLKKVSLSQAKLYAKFSVLGELAYDIPSIKPENLLKRHSLHYVTSSIEKREQLAEAEKKEKLAKAEAESEESSQVEITQGDDQKNDVRKSTAYQIAVSAASYLHSRAQALLPARSSKDEEDHKTSESDERSINSEMASLMATTDSVTAVVAAKEEVKQAVAEDLSSISSSPCEWFVCDDDKTSTRFFVIQGSETLASWQANLLFEPMQFEGLDVFVHRGIYEAAKGIYQQMLPEIHAYMKSHGPHAKFRFTGHSLGGSLSMLINLMLLIREEVPYASLLPVITFGSPCVMCGGDDLLRMLGLPKNHVQAIVMHRDIVPRAFSCNYPRPAAQLLKALNKSFRNYPCLDTQKQLYGPMGEMLILQPDSKISPQHDLLPSGSGLYLLTFNMDDSTKTENQLQAAKNAFLNRPHPLQILTDRSSYGKGGAIRRDHDMNSYLKCMRTVIRQELSRVRRAERELCRKSWLWPLIKPRVIETGIVLGPPLAQSNKFSAQLNFAGAFNSGRESLKRLSRLVASQHMHLFLVLLFPARLLIIGAYSIFPR